MSDEAFHEIQLNGKQLVFLFMAGTVVAVVIFLCGVMVGRGVEPARTAASTPSTPGVVIDPTAPEPVAVAGSSSNAPLTAQETLTYAERLESPARAEESLRPAVETASLPQPVAEPVPQPPVTEPVPAEPVAPAPTPAVAPVTAAPSRASFTEPAGTGLVVQVAASRSRAEAETIARRLSEKGYPVFITTNAGNFRVRVGKYATAGEAEAIGARLEREEQFRPWITR
jgi:cell division septation protein DedD